MLTWMNVKQGLENCGEKVNKKLRQLHNKETLMSVKKEDMKYEEQENALRYLTFVIENRDRKIKACRQQESTIRQEASFPTLSLKEIMLSYANDAKGNRLRKTWLRMY